MRTCKRPRRWSLGSLILAVLLASCGGGDETTEQLAVGTDSTPDPTPSSLVPPTDRRTEGRSTTSRPAPTPSIRRSSQEPADGPSPGQARQVPTGGVSAQFSAGSVLQRKDVLPGGVSAQFQVGSIQPWPFLEVVFGPPSNPVSVPVNPVSLPIGETAAFVAKGSGFDSVSAIWEVTLPDGSLKSPPVDDVSFRWTAAIGDPIGRHKLTVRHGTKSANIWVDVTMPDTPTMVSLSPGVAVAGTVFAVGLTGFRANQRIQLDLYRLADGAPSRGSYEFQAVLSSVDTDERGEAIFYLRTRADDPEGNYCIVPRYAKWRYAGKFPFPPEFAAGCAGFEVRRG
jgi:hypothetical protein